LQGKKKKGGEASILQSTSEREGEGITGRRTGRRENTLRRVKKKGEEKGGNYQFIGRAFGASTKGRE